jgi:hypothetical protein
VAVTTPFAYTVGLFGLEPNPGEIVFAANRHYRRLRTPPRRRETRRLRLRRYLSRSRSVVALTNGALRPEEGEIDGTDGVQL